MTIFRPVQYGFLYPDFTFLQYHTYWYVLEKGQKGPAATKFFYAFDLLGQFGLPETHFYF